MIASRRFVWKYGFRLIFVDEETNTVNAIVHENTAGTMARRGTLQIPEPFGDDFSFMVQIFYLLISLQLKEGC